ncbi:Sir2 family NAD-dependent protein deacetylase [Pusillimonas sp. ANT_WB101]|uniref:SIR2 family NAD-dependent protein deacylase n=1 Tax=Pusillimonas sp. ANT_WB101 TaxID=2597356 RepID=UPI0011ED4C2C|nr:Sir2 family NAD-dependent protein deacetylase [Pusillimonas sp. ANT_WB101]KAA0911242.1 NAD-dependent deacetylase [Pusillimonas sp. ANT_WB101]
MTQHPYSHALNKAAELICSADSILITAGAGMGVDSGLPDFRGDDGFWRAYPALRRAGLSFIDMASPIHFQKTPHRAWGFYGHRLAMYRETEPHEGFYILRDIAARLEHGAFVFTSNVDGHFGKAGFDDSRMVECHGSIHYLQCLNTCQSEVWPATNFTPQVDEQRCELLNDTPVCPYCSGIARPNILMFNDWDWVEARSEQQHHALGLWRRKVRAPVVIELGAGTALPTIRYFGEQQRVPLIRINLREAQGHHRKEIVSLPMRALDALTSLHGALDGRGFF